MSEQKGLAPAQNLQDTISNIVPCACALVQLSWQSQVAFFVCPGVENKHRLPAISVVTVVRYEVQCFGERRQVSAAVVQNRKSQGEVGQQVCSGVHLVHGPAERLNVLQLVLRLQVLSAETINVHRVDLFDEGNIQVAFLDVAIHLKIRDDNCGCQKDS